MGSFRSADTEMDTEHALSCLKVIAETLNPKFRGKFFAVDGTLLGLIRNGGVIAGDNDVDIAMRIEDYDPEILELLVDAGFVVLERKGSVKKGLMLKLGYGKIPVDIYFYYKVAAERWVYSLRKLGKTLCWRRPDFDLSVRRFGDFEIAIPNPPEEFLVAGYGPSWRRPSRRWSKYCAPNVSPEGGALVQLRFQLKRWLWHRKNGDIYRDSTVPERKVVFTDGVFDMFHVNHLAVLREARALGDRLVVGVVSDEAAMSYKGKPVIPEDERLEVVRAIAEVDDAFIMRGDISAQTLGRYVKECGASIVAYAGTGFDDYFAEVKAAGMFRQLDRHAGVSSSEIRERIRRRDESAKIP